MVNLQQGKRVMNLRHGKGSENESFAQSLDVGLCANYCGGDMCPRRLGSVIRSIGKWLPLPKEGFLWFGTVGAEDIGMSCRSVLHTRVACPYACSARWVLNGIRDVSRLATCPFVNSAGRVQNGRVPNKRCDIIMRGPLCVRHGGCRTEGLEKRRRATIHDVMGRVELPLFDLESPPRLALGMKELFLEGTEDTDFAFFQQQKHEVTLAMHRQEVPLINAFLTRAFGDMYLTLAGTETAKVGRLEREVEETSRLLEAVKEARAKAERKKVEELAAPCVEEVEEYKGSDEFKNLVLDMMVEE
ncbi:hypothetical protein L3X38_011054 [Prunus dulcis]|uniref:Uncharacterized protein n=1 Tax=Prunus dulcis TaxID=3755 RepID=A0AAD4ZFC2_PRUDU|nr:hypothetical protein L3X38_011054 [Prunus dulcis]